MFHNLPKEHHQLETSFQIHEPMGHFSFKPQYLLLSQTCSGMWQQLNGLWTGKPLALWLSDLLEVILGKLINLSKYNLSDMQLRYHLCLLEGSVWCQRHTKGTISAHSEMFTWGVCLLSFFLCSPTWSLAGHWKTLISVVPGRIPQTQ